MNEVINSALVHQLDALVEENKSRLVILRSDYLILNEVHTFIAEMNRCYTGKTADSFWRGRDNLENTAFHRWIERERRICLGETDFDGDDVYINFTKGSLKDCIYLNLHTKGARKSYVLIEEKGLYLHEETRYVEDRLLIFSQ